jgi:hypothetical integral membrane protein (TIGR02206 family)
MALVLALVGAGPEGAHPAPYLRLLGPTHLAILGAVVLVGAVLAFVQRRLRPEVRWLRMGVGSILLVETGLWYAYNASLGQLRFPDHLPLDLCDATLYLTIAALLTLSPAVYDVAYCWALAGTSMALLTPDLWERFPSLSTVQFFFAHGLVVAAVLFLMWSSLARPRRGAAVRAFVALNLFAAFDGAFDWIFRTNYMYLAAKPKNASLLSILGPWPFYLLAAEGVALVLFLLLCFPYRERAQDAVGGNARRGK